MNTIKPSRPKITIFPTIIIATFPALVPIILPIDVNAKNKPTWLIANAPTLMNDTVEENIELPLLYSGLTPKEAKDRVHEVLTKVGLPDKGKKHPKQLSGGQQQRVAIARAIVNRPSFIIADEPTGALDSKTSEEILTLFQQLNNEGVTIILVTHDEETIEYCNRLIKVRDGKILEEVLT